MTSKIYPYCLWKIRTAGGVHCTGVFWKTPPPAVLYWDLNLNVESGRSPLPTYMASTSKSRIYWHTCDCLNHRLLGIWIQILQVDSTSKSRPFMWTPHVIPGLTSITYMEFTSSVPIPTLWNSKNNYIQSHIACIIFDLLYSRTHECRYSWEYSSLLKPMAPPWKHPKGVLGRRCPREDRFVK